MKLTKTIMQKEGTVNMKQTHTHAILKVLRPTRGLMFRERYLIGIKGSKKDWDDRCPPVCLWVPEGAVAVATRAPAPGERTKPTSSRSSPRARPEDACWHEGFTRPRASHLDFHATDLILKYQAILLVWLLILFSLNPVGFRLSLISPKYGLCFSCRNLFFFLNPQWFKRKSLETWVLKWLNKQKAGGKKNHTFVMSLKPSHFNRGFWAGFGHGLAILQTLPSAAAGSWQTA